MIQNRILRQISSYEFHYNLEHSKEIYRYLPKYNMVINWFNPNGLEPYDILKENVLDCSGNEMGTLKQYLNKIRSQKYCLLGNLANGGDPNIDIICSHHIVYFRDEFDWFNGQTNDHTIYDFMIMIDDELHLDI